RHVIGEHADEVHRPDRRAERDGGHREHEAAPRAFEAPDLARQHDRDKAALNGNKDRARHQYGIVIVPSVHGYFVPASDKLDYIALGGPASYIFLNWAQGVRA